MHAARAIELDPEDAEAYGVLGDAHLETGRYDEAEKAYQRMSQLGESLGSYGRLSGLKSIHGDSQGSIADLQAAIRLGQTSGAPRESVAWAQWQLASEHFGCGDLRAAEAGFHAALATYPDYLRALAGLGRSMRRGSASLRPSSGTGRRSESSRSRSTPPRWETSTRAWDKRARP